jgi:hypothetical protein
LPLGYRDGAESIWSITITREPNLKISERVSLGGYWDGSRLFTTYSPIDSNLYRLVSAEIIAFDPEPEVRWILG